VKDCESCVHEYLSPMSDVCRECGIAMLNYKERTPAVTNADRIRGMSDEELADFLLHICDWNWLDWLKAPADKEGE